MRGKTLFITGASRGIGEAIALRCAKEGANIVIAAKTDAPHPTLPGTIHTVAEEVEKLGGKALPVKMDIRFEEQVNAAVEKAVETFGGIDVLVNNASAIFPMPTLHTPMKKFDLMFSCNVRGTFMCSQICLPHLMKGENPHILNLSPPLNVDAKWFKDHVAYSMSKYGMSFCTLGMSAEFVEAGVAVNSLWPKTLIGTSAISVLFPQLYDHSRRPEIVAEAACAILKRNSREFTGNFCIDEGILQEEGITDFSSYAVDPNQTLHKDLYLD